MASTSAMAAAIGAYFVLSHGNAPIANPFAARTPVVAPSGRHASAVSTARAPGISGYTVNELNRNGAVSATDAHANVAAAGDPLASHVHRHSSVAASDAIATSSAMTPG